MKHPNCGLRLQKCCVPITQSIVNCPECKIGKLKVKDEPLEAWNKVDRYLYCDTCGKFNVLHGVNI